MTRRVNQLSALLVRSLAAPGYYGGGNGLYLQISPSGAKSWIFKFSVAGKRREMGLGPLHTFTLAIARDRAVECRRLVAAGVDPIVERDSARTSEALSKARSKTFDQCAKAYINAHRGSWKSAKHAAMERISDTTGGKIAAAIKARAAGMAADAQSAQFYGDSLSAGAGTVDARAEVAAFRGRGGKPS